MFFDLTPEIILDKKSEKIYFYSRLGLCLIFLGLSVFLSLIIIFPAKYFYFSFASPNANSNTINTPRNQSGNLPEGGKIKKDENFYFNANSFGNFSKARVNLKINDENSSLENVSVSAKKSFQAFFYPTDVPIGFKDGSLLYSLGKYFIVSNGELHQFENEALIYSLGFSKNNFSDVSADDLKYNNIGNKIATGENYPDSTIFKIDDEYYILNGEKLKKFISINAFLSQYSAKLAIEKEASFLEKYPIDENLIGFADGSLIAYGESAFVVSGNQNFPIDSPETFEALGYNWDDLISIGGDELSFYTKGFLMNIRKVHPNGTIFLALDKDGKNREWYLAKDGKKHLLPTNEIAASWNKKTPIFVSSESLTQSSDCELKKDWFRSGIYSCDIFIDGLQGLIGKDYEFNTNFDKDVKISEISAKFTQEYTYANLRRFLSNTLNSIITRYASRI